MYHEPLRKTQLQTVTIALVLAAVLTRLRGGLVRWLTVAVLILWPALGGHYVELCFLNWLRPRLPSSLAAQLAARVGVWFAGGVILLLCMRLTAMALGTFRPEHWPAWWVGGLAFIGIELVVHLILQLRGRASFYNGRG
jgi:hypothetical protein